MLVCPGFNRSWHANVIRDVASEKDLDLVVCPPDDGINREAKTFLDFEKIAPSLLLVMYHLLSGLDRLERTWPLNGIPARRRRVVGPADVPLPCFDATAGNVGLDRYYMIAGDRDISD